jgi:arylsulfatase A-like enzyme
MRNILFILVDCLRADAVCGKDRGTVTPAIDKLMNRGTYFNQAISTAGTTTTCVASMLTGNYPFAHGIRTLSGYKLNSECVTLPQVLKHHGYHTYAMVSGPLSPITGLDRGFDEYEYRTDGVYLSDDWGENLRRRFQQKQLRQPWFAFLHLWEVHKPRKVLPQFDSKQFGADKYERAVSSLDPELEKLINLLGDDTIIILHGDHGENREVARRNLLARFYRLKRRFSYPVDPRYYKVGHGFHVYDFIVRVPLLFYGPGVFPSGKTITDQVRQIDFFPTLVEALGLPMPLPVHGRSLVPLIKGEPLPEVPAHVAAVGGPLQGSKNWRVGIRTREWKYVFAPQNPTIPEEVYHLRTDPQEWRNLSKTQRPKAEELKRELLDIISGTYYMTGATAGEEMSAQEKKTMEERLKQLGYL